jgi:sec-independent protein translocase protein TatB
VLDINGQEFVILLLVAVVVIGPERLPRYAREFRGWVTKARDLLGDVRASMRDEMGDTVDFAALDLRQYDPRHIVKEVLAEGDPASPSARSDGRAARRRSARVATDAVPPFDADAT